LQISKDKAHPINYIGPIEAISEDNIAEQIKTADILFIEKESDECIGTNKTFKCDNSA